MRLSCAITRLLAYSNDCFSTDTAYTRCVFRSMLFFPHVAHIGMADLSARAVRSRGLGLLASLLQRDPSKLGNSSPMKFLG